MTPTRDDAWQLLCEWTQGENLRRHGLAVEAAVAWYGEHRFGVSGAELERWRMAGLLHDFDYERYPESHPRPGAPRSCGGWATPRRSWRPCSATATTRASRARPTLAHAVYACDEMSGFVIAVALVRPNRSLDEVDVERGAQEDEGQGLRPPGATRPARRRAPRSSGCPSTSTSPTSSPA